MKRTPSNIAQHYINALQSTVFKYTGQKLNTIPRGLLSPPMIASDRFLAGMYDCLESFGDIQLLDIYRKFVSKFIVGKSDSDPAEWLEYQLKLTPRQVNWLGIYDTNAVKDYSVSEYVWVCLLALLANRSSKGSTIGPTHFKVNLQGFTVGYEQSAGSVRDVDVLVRPRVPNALRIVSARRFIPLSDSQSNPFTMYVSALRKMSMTDSKRDSWEEVISILYFIRGVSIPRPKPQPNVFVQKVDDLSRRLIRQRLGHNPIPEIVETLKDICPASEDAFWGALPYQDWANLPRNKACWVPKAELIQALDKLRSLA